MDTNADIIDVGSVQVLISEIAGLDEGNIYLKSGRNIILNGEEEHDKLRTALRKVSKVVTVEKIACEGCDHQITMVSVGTSYKACGLQNNKAISEIILRDPTCPIRANWR